MQHQGMTTKEFKGVCLDDLCSLERVFSTNVYVYELKEDEEGKVTAELVRRSPYTFDQTMNLNLYGDHFSYINDMSKYSQSYACKKCDRLWKHVGHLHRHEQTCQANVRYRYPGGVYHPTKRVFDQLEDEGIEVPEEDRYFPYRATFDIEVMLQPTDKQRSVKVEWTSQHVLLSISVCSNVPEYTKPVCFVSEGNTADVVDACLRHLTEISDKAFRLLLPKYTGVLQQIEEKLDKTWKSVVTTKNENARRRAIICTTCPSA